MVKLNEDILYLIFEELKDNNNALYSCLLTNRTWCKITIPILWKNPWKFLKDMEREQMELLLNVIILHLTNESKNTLKSKCTELLRFLMNPYQKPLFDYISFCRHLDFINIDIIIMEFAAIESENILMREIINLFINRSRKFTHLYIPYKFNFQIHLIPEARNCLSEIEFFFCKTSINDDIVVGLAEICKSIKKLDFFINDENFGIIRLIEVQRNLINLNLKSHYLLNDNKPLVKNLENSLIKHANTIQYLRISKPYIKILTTFVNLKVLELDSDSDYTWNCLENLSIPFLQILRARSVPIKILTNLIENTSGYLIEIKIDHIYHNEVGNKKIIQVIYQNCPNLIYLKLVLRNNNILELENLLINCQYLNGLYILIGDIFDWDKLFEILTRLSPKSLFKFKFNYLVPKLNSLKSFFDNWKGRHSMYLQLNEMRDIEGLVIEKYKLEGIIKKFNNKILNDEFEWT
ncbi:hypothetical protein RclHR1_01660022 [Rhizophagus clarus]|uniref:F-box domain-containing protein n=1 Tax=Rhizophagus clarus TaxID=94130 RepID=A0A2Z6QI00_9GLOM|nr:hypothetical protein RclHR1_01660022 [Rhizophagus clarus]GES74757.1 hypothetical protein GLOIN_2v1777651 [Rhizophagus clarus]